MMRSWFYNEADTYSCVMWQLFAADGVCVESDRAQEQSNFQFILIRICFQNSDYLSFKLKDSTVPPFP